MCVRLEDVMTGNKITLEEAHFTTNPPPQPCLDRTLYTVYIYRRRRMHAYTLHNGVVTTSIAYCELCYCNVLILKPLHILCIKLQHRFKSHQLLYTSKFILVPFPLAGKGLAFKH